MTLRDWVRVFGAFERAPNGCWIADVSLNRTATPVLKVGGRTLSLRAVLRRLCPERRGRPTVPCTSRECVHPMHSRRVREAQPA